MGAPEIKYGDSICYVQHVDSGLWLTYQAVDAKSARMGGARRKVNLQSHERRSPCENVENVLSHGFTY